jgi:rRNA maturation endonuclease Nob1
MDNEYINKGKLIEEIRKAASRSMVGEIDEPYLDWKTVVSFIFDAPAEAVQPVIEGTWSNYSYTMMECSECKKHVPYHRYEFCPHCGAKMKKEN